MKAIITSPVEDYMGISASVAFADGKAEADISESQLEYFKSAGYKVKILDAKTGGKAKKDAKTGGKAKKDAKTGGKAKKDAKTGDEAEKDAKTGDEAEKVINEQEAGDKEAEAEANGEAK